jgi:hypothetical protein
MLAPRGHFLTPTARRPVPDPGRFMAALILSVLTLYVTILNVGGFTLPGAPTAISAGGIPGGRLPAAPAAGSPA